MINYLRQLKRNYRDHIYKKEASDIKFYSRILNENKSIRSITLENNRFILNLANGLKFEWDPSDRYSCLGLATTPDYEQFELNLILELISPADTVLDIGANFGYFTVYLKKHLPSLEIYSFEPVKRTYHLLNRNLELNELTAATFNLGFSDQNAEVTFYLPEKLGPAWASMGRGVNSVLKYKLFEEICTVKKLDDFITLQSIKGLDFIKCDVEGAEKLVVMGGEQTIQTSKPTMMLEIGDKWTSHFGYNRVSFIEYLIDKFDYKCFGVFKDKLIKISEPDDAKQYSEDSMYNYFFIHPSKPAYQAILSNYFN